MPSPTFVCVFALLVFTTIPLNCLLTFFQLLPYPMHTVVAPPRVALRDEYPCLALRYSTYHSLPILFFKFIVPLSIPFRFFIPNPFIPSARQLAPFIYCTLSPRPFCSLLVPVIVNVATSLDSSHRHCLSVGRRRLTGPRAHRPGILVHYITPLDWNINSMAYYDPLARDVCASLARSWVRTDGEIRVWGRVARRGLHKL